MEFYYIAADDAVTDEDLDEGRELYVIMRQFIRGNQLLEDFAYEGMTLERAAARCEDLNLRAARIRLESMAKLEALTSQ